jgi:type II secretory pathway component PulM
MSKAKATESTSTTLIPLIARATHTWESLVQTVPEPTQAQLDLYAVRTPPAALVERGSHIRSEKIRTDLVRLGGIAANFYPQATAAQRRLLLGFSSALLSVTVYSGVKLGEMLERRGATVGDREATLAANATTAATAYQEGMSERDRLATALETAVDDEATLETRLDSARGQVSNHATLAASLLALVKLGRELLLDKASQAGRQLAEGGLTEADLDETQALAARVKASGANATGARIQGSVSQADLDLQDGVCLSYLDRMMKIWNGAHERDPSIPQLLPIATRRLFSPNRKRAVEAPPAEKAAETPAEDDKKPV